MTNPTALREELERLHKEAGAPQPVFSTYKQGDLLMGGIYYGEIWAGDFDFSRRVLNPLVVSILNNLPTILNALKVVEVAREYHDAKKEYARRNGDGVYRSEVEENNYQLKLFSLLKPFEE